MYVYTAKGRRIVQGTGTPPNWVSTATKSVVSTMHFDAQLASHGSLAGKKKRLNWITSHLKLCGHFANHKQGTKTLVNPVHFVLKLCNFSTPKFPPAYSYTLTKRWDDATNNAWCGETRPHTSRLSHKGLAQHSTSVCTMMCSLRHTHQ